MTWRDSMREGLAELRRQIDRNAQQGTTLATLVRPSFLGNHPGPLTTIIEPIVVAATLLMLLLATGAGVLGAALLMVACALVYFILTQILGLKLDIDLPQHL